MTEFLKGNYELTVKIEEPADEAETSATEEFEKKALSRLGGSICFLWNGDTPEK